MRKSKIKSTVLCTAAVILIAVFTIKTARGERPGDSSSGISENEEAESVTETDVTLPDTASGVGSDQNGTMHPSDDEQVDFGDIPTENLTTEDLEKLEQYIGSTGGLPFQPNSLLPDPENTVGRYRNRVLSCEFPGGSVLRIGTDEENSDALYLNPVFEVSDEEALYSAGEDEFAFYFLSSSADDIAFSTENVGTTLSFPEEDRYFCVTDRTYDTLVPAEFRNAQDFGVKWTDLNNYHGFDGSDSDVRIRVVRPTDGRLLGTAILHIRFDIESCTYIPEALVNSEAVECGFMTEADRDKLVDRAFEFFASGISGFNANVDRSQWSNFKPLAIVEKTERFYFSRFFGEDSEVKSGGDYNGVQVYAVNLNYPNFGFVTVYCASEMQLYGLWGEGGEIDRIVPFAYDAMFPFSKDTLAVADYLMEDFYGTTAGKPMA